MLAAALGRRSPGARVIFPTTLYLTWHGLGDLRPALSAGEARYWNPVAVFAETLEAVPVIERQGFKLHMTFDDGNDSDFKHAFELLSAHQQTGSFFVCASRIDQPHYLSAAQLRRMHAAGMTIGSHGYDHVNWSATPDDQLTREFIDARERIEDAIGAPVDAASVPFGMVDRRVVQWAIKAGFTRLFTSSGGFATGSTGLIPRNSIISGFSPDADLDKLLALRWRAKSAFRDPIRRLRYWGIPMGLPPQALRESPIAD
jgi:peptidoglycan/xylan/chitin deacetylase (PgdA/CDA1 family)